MAETDDDRNRRVARLASMSPLVRRKVDAELYRTNLETDEVTPETIQQEAFLLFLEELTDIGIVTTTSAAELYGNSGDMDALLDAFEWIVPTTLYPKLKGDADLVSCLADILSGGISIGGSLLSVWLDFLGGVDHIPGYRPDIEYGVQYIRDRFTSTGAFNSMLSGLITNVAASKSMTHMDVDTHTGLVNVVAELRKRLTEGLAAVTNGCVDLLNDELAKLARRIDFTLLGLTAPDKAASNAWLFTTNTSEMAEYETAIYNKKRREFNCGCKLSPLYFTTRGIKITSMDYVGFAIYLYARCETFEVFKTRFSRIQKVLSDVISDDLYGEVMQDIQTAFNNRSDSETSEDPS